MDVGLLLIRMGLVLYVALRLAFWLSVAIIPIWFVFKFVF